MRMMRGYLDTVGGTTTVTASALPGKFCGLRCLCVRRRR
jgi:hypothetical protein